MSWLAHAKNKEQSDVHLIGELVCHQISWCGTHHGEAEPDAACGQQAEGSLIRYLLALSALEGSPDFANAYQSTRLRLQVELYSLTWRGGPRYVPP